MVIHQVPSSSGLALSKIFSWLQGGCKGLSQGRLRLLDKPAAFPIHAACCRSSISGGLVCQACNVAEQCDHQFASRELATCHGGEPYGPLYAGWMQGGWHRDAWGLWTSRQLPLWNPSCGAVPLRDPCLPTSLRHWRQQWRLWVVQPSLWADPIQLWQPWLWSAGDWLWLHKLGLILYISSQWLLQIVQPSRWPDSIRLWQPGLWPAGACLVAQQPGLCPECLIQSSGTLVDSLGVKLLQLGPILMELPSSCVINVIYSFGQVLL